MKTVTIITGNTGVGKSTVAQRLMHALPESGWHDDQSWKTNPPLGFQNNRMKQRMLGVASVCAAAADAYFAAGLDHVILSGVLPGDIHFQNIRAALATADVRFRVFWLTCGPEVQQQRLVGRDGHDQTMIDVSEYLEGSAAVPIDCTSASADDVASTILELMKEDG